MKRAVKWTSTDVDERRPSTGWKSTVWSTSTTRKRQVEKGRLTSTTRKRHFMETEIEFWPLNWHIS